MKVFNVSSYIMLLSLLLSLAVEEPRTITKVVKLLEGMLDQSKADGESDRELYSKFKCYIDDNTEEKTKLVEDLTTQIGLLESKIEALQGENGALSADVAKLQADIAANEQAREQAEALRTKAKEDFDAEEADLVAAIDQLAQAVEILATIGSDQTLQSATDHSKFMAGYSAESGALLKLRTSVKHALIAANTFLAPSQRRKVESFLQAAGTVPFTGTYTAQSGEIIGILKQMKETFTSNLEAARTAEAAAVEAHTKFMDTKLEEHGTMTATYNEKQEILGDNDGDLATKKQQLDESITQKSEAEAFLEKLEAMGVAKAKEYEARKVLRANEEAAIAKAIAILNNDEAFHAFGKVQATSTGATGPSASFLQLRAIRRHASSKHLKRRSTTNSTIRDERDRLTASRLLERCATRSKRVRRVFLLLETGNPFLKVLAEIEKMQTVIDEEGKLDAKQLAWCNKERDENNQNLQAKNDAIGTINTEITNLVNSIDDPETGLKKQIIDTEESLETNSKSQKEETAERRDAAKLYSKTISDAVEAQSLLQRAVTALKKYYEAMDKQDMAMLARGSALLQRRQTPPETWTGEYKGQLDGATDVIQMLEFIQDETKKEETLAHDAELSAQQSYEDSMAELKAEEGTLQTSLVTLKKTLADKELELENQREALDITTREKVAIERYLLQIKPGCDFITTNFDMRESNRAEEKAALTKAVELITATPAYKAAVSDAELAALGSCQALCLGGNRTHAPCEACLAGVSVPGYCAGHPGVEGC